MLEYYRAKEGNLDILANAGMGIYGATEYTDLADARYLFDVNFAPVRLGPESASPDA